MNDTTNLFSLSGRVALITGASRGLGRAIAKGFAAAGTGVALVARDQTQLDSLAREIGETTGMKAQAIAADIGAFAESRRAVDLAVAEFGRIDILVNSAGIVSRGPLEQATEADFHQGMNVNALGTWAMCQAVTPVMRANGGGSIINLTSAAGVLGMANRSIYGATKAAVIQITRSLAVELAPFGIRVNALSPGPFATEGTEDSRRSDRWQAMIDQRIPQRRTADPAELQGPAIFLASAASSFVTGAVLAVDGGFTAA